MDRFYVFILRNDVWIYILSSLALIWYLSELWRSQRLLKSAVFGLEKEKGRRNRQRALSLVVLFAAVIGFLTYVNIQVAPTLPQELLRPPTPTPNIFATPLTPPTPVENQTTATIVIAPTVTLRGGSTDDQNPQPTDDTGDVETATPIPDIITGDCSPEVNITAPPDGATVVDAVTFFGSASGESFGSYFVEYLGANTEGVWRTVSEPVSVPVLDGILVSLDLQGWSSGSNFFRLTVLDQNQAVIDQCVIELLVEGNGS